MFITLYFIVTKGKGGRGGGGGSGGSGGGSSGGGGGSGSGGGSGGSGGGGGGSSGGGGSGGTGSGGSWAGAIQRGGGSGSCPYVIRTGDRAGQTRGKLHTQHHCFSRLDDAWRAEFGDEAKRPHWAELLRSGVAIFDLDHDAILADMYALFVSAEGDCYLCVPPDPGIEATALGASESALPGTAPAEALHTFTLDSGLHLPSFSTNMVSGAALHDAMVTTTTPGGQRVSICMCTRMGRHLAMFTRWPRSSLYTLATEPPQVAASTQVSAPGPVAPPCSCRLLSHQTLLWHHRLGHPSLPRLRGVHSRLLVSGLPRSLPPLPPSPPPPCLPCIEGRQRAAPHSSFPPMSALMQNLHMDVWGPACVSGHGRERYFLLVVDDYTRYTTRFREDLSVLRLHSDRGGEFSSDLLRDFCRGEGILQSFTLPDSPQQNGIAERRIGLVMEVARTSMIHAAAPYFLWPLPCALAQPLAQCLLAEDLAYTALDGEGWRCVGVPGRPLPGIVPVVVAVTSGAGRGAVSGGAEPGGSESKGTESGGAEPGGAEPGGAELVGVEPEGAEREGVEFAGAESGGAEPWGTASSRGPAGASPRLSPRAEPLSPQQLREWFAQRTRLWSGAARAKDTGAGGAAAAGPGGSHTRGTRAAGTGHVGGAGAGGSGAGDPTESGGSGAGGTGAGGAGAEGAGAVDPGAGGAGAGGTGAGGAGAGGVGAVDPGAGGAGAGGTASAGLCVLGLPTSLVLSPPLLCPLPNQTKPPFQPASPLPTTSPYTEQTGGLTERREPASHLASPVRTGRRVPRPRPPPVPGTHAMSLHPSSVPLRVSLPLPESSLPTVPDLASDLARVASPIVSRLLATVVTDPSFESTAASALVAELVDFAATSHLDYATALAAESESPSPPYVGGKCALGTDVLEERQEYFECLAVAVPRFASILLAPEGDPDAPDIPTPRSYAEAITGTYVDAVPPSGANIFDGMWIFRVKRPSGSPPAFKARYVARGFSHLHQEIWLRSPPGFTGSFPAGTQWSLRRLVYGLRQAPREWHDILRTTLAALGIAPSTPDPSMFLRTDTSLPPFYVEDLVFATADTEALTLVKSELQKRHTCTDLGELCSYLGLQIIRDRARRTITLTQSHMVYQVLQCFGFQFSSPQPTPLSTGHSFSSPRSDESVVPSGPYPELVGCLMYLMTCTRPDLAYPLSLLARYVARGRHQKVHRDAAKRVLHYFCNTSGMGLVLGGRGPVVLTGHTDASWVDDSATQQLSQGYTFSLGSDSVSWRSTRSSSVLSSSCEAEIYAGAMAAQELRWLTYLLTDLGEQPRSPLVLYVDNKAMIALCQEHRVEHQTKHIALRYFLARELQQRGQLCLVYVATRANTADIFTKALPPDDHQRFSTMLGLVPSLPHLLATLLVL
ncbi:unnamed protein product [Closterium sp. NIES-54]